MPPAAPAPGGSLRSSAALSRQATSAADRYLRHAAARRQQASCSEWKPGDILKVPPIGPEVTVEGMVRRPAIYELEGKTSLAQVLELAGGVLPSGALRHIDVERMVAHEKRTMLRLDLPQTNDAQAVNKALRGFPGAGRRQDTNLAHRLLQRQDDLSRRARFPSREDIPIKKE